MTAATTTTTPSKTQAAYNADPSYEGTTLTFAQIEALWIKANPTQALWAPLMAGIAEAESGGRTGALNDAGTTTGASADYSVGLWQINYLGSLLDGRTQEYGSPGYLQQNPLAQAQAAGALLGNGAGISNWEGDPVGQYFMSSGSAPSLSAVLSVVSQKGYDTTGAIDPSQYSSAQLTDWVNPVINTIEGAAGLAEPAGSQTLPAAKQAASGLAGGEAAAGAGGLEAIYDDLTSSVWWKRVGVFAAGIALVVGGIILFVSESKTGQTLISGGGQAAAASGGSSGGAGLAEVAEAA